MAQYYVAEIDKKTCQEIEFSRIECEDAVDAHSTLTLLQDHEPTREFMYVVTLTPQEQASWTHTCVSCNCQFDIRGDLIP